MAHRHLNRELVGQWVKPLLLHKGSEQQKELLRHALGDSPGEFVRFVESSIAGEDERPIYRGEGDVPTLLGADGKPVITLMPGHMYLMPPDDIVALHGHWRGIPVEEAADPSLWGAITLAEIREERIKPAWLAVHNKCDEDVARADLDKAIKSDNVLVTDGMVRRILRWMMAPGHMRGAAELYGNCSLAKAWWCGHFAKLCAEDLRGIPAAGDLDHRKASRALKGIWLELADYLSGKLTVVSERNVLNGIALWARQDTEEATVPRARVKRVMLGIGEVSSWCVLGARTAEQVFETIQGLLRQPEEATTAQ